MGAIGAGEILLLVLVALLIFGPGKLADMGKGLGDGLKNFKKGLHPEDPPKREVATEKPPEPPKAAPPVQASGQPEKPPDPEGGPSSPGAS